MDKETMEPTDKLAPDSLHAGTQIGSKAKTLTEAIKVVEVIYILTSMYTNKSEGSQL